MSTTLTWFNSGLGTKTGTTVAHLFADLVTLIGSKSGDSDFKWEVKGSNTGSSPYYISLGRKDGSPGRIGIFCWSSSPAGNNATILETGPSSNTVYIAWFPNGTGTTMANLAASSGAITGDDTNAIKVVPCASVTSQLYTTNMQPFYFESADAMVFGFQNPAGPTLHWMGAGDLLVDSADVAYGCALGFGTQSAHTFTASTPTLAWTASAMSAGGVSPCIRSNYGGANALYFQAYAPTGTWGSLSYGQHALNPLIDTATQDVYFAPMLLLGQSKGVGMCKLRQIGIGPGTNGAFGVHNVTGPVVTARQFNAYTTGGGGYPWFTNDKL